jgi:hypothetical protein
MVHTTPTKVLVATTLRPLVGPLSDSLAQGVRLIQQGLREEPTPQKMATFEGELSALWREGGRRRMAWVVHHLETEHTAAAPSRVQWEGRLYPSTREISERYRDARWSRGRLATPLCTAGPWGPCPPAVGTPSRTCRRARPPALAECVGQWAADHPQRQVLAMLAKAHNVHGACTSLRKVLASLSAGLTPHRHVSQVEHVVHWLEQARASQGRYRPTLSVGRDGIFVPLQPQGWQEGATATVSVLDRRGKRRGTVYLGHMPEPGQGTVTAPLRAVLKPTFKGGVVRGNAFCPVGAP